MCSSSSWIWLTKMLLSGIEAPVKVVVSAAMLGSRAAVKEAFAPPLRMLPPVLEIYVVWHPGDEEGKAAAGQILDHFHGTAFSGLIGGAVEVYLRSAGWSDPTDSPRPLPFMAPFPQGVAAPTLAAVVPVLGNALALALEERSGPWHDYIAAIAAARTESPERIAVFPLAVDPGVLDRTRLSELLGGVQGIGAPTQAVAEPVAELRCRDLAQGLAQFAAGP